MAILLLYPKKAISSFSSDIEPLKFTYIIHTSGLLPLRGKGG